MEYIKDKKLINSEYVEKFRIWLLKNADKYFSKKDNHAKHWRDFCYWNNPVDRKHLVMNNEVMLIDREIDGVHCYVICRILGNTDNPKPRVEHVAKVIEIDKLKRKDWRNGYFLLPKLTKT